MHMHSHSHSHIISSIRIMINPLSSLFLAPAPKNLAISRSPHIINDSPNYLHPYHSGRQAFRILRVPTYADRTTIL